MVRTIKSVLLFDYDSIHRSLSLSSPTIADHLGSKAGTWLEAVETGEASAQSISDVRRRFQLRRGYADPKLLGKNRGWLTANGVQVVDCPPPAGMRFGASAANLMLDALDVIEGDPEEIILLAADYDLSPLLLRLRARNQRVVIYATPTTPASYRAHADGAIEESLLFAILSRPTDSTADIVKGSIPRPPVIANAALRRLSPSRPEALPEPAPTPAPARAPRGPVDREALAALVRRIHDATSIPLFSPKTFADLFRTLVEEIDNNGYKFQATAENVAGSLNALGRNVTKRQVGFVVKGLALRGHIFSPDDQPEDLAEAFYEQVLYLVDGAKIALTDEERGLVGAWIGVRREDDSEPAPAPAQAQVTGPPRPTASARPPADRQPRRRADAPSHGMPEPTGLPPRKPAASAAPPRSSGTAQPRPAPAAAQGAPIAMPEPPPRPARPASRQTQAAAEPIPAAPAMPSPPPRPTAKAAAEPANAELEDSILSAIADAVDILVEDEKPARRPAPQQRPEPAAAAPAAAPRVRPAAPAATPAPKAAAAAESDEIGDEIQRILATYNNERR
jgi:hypothetical protein